MKNKDYCKKVFSEELEKEGFDGVTLKIINSPIVKSNGYVKPNIKNGKYEVVINLNSFKNLSSDDAMFYMYETIAHEIEHIKTFEKTKEDGFCDYEHFVSLLEYISYLYELRQPAIDINMSLVKRVILSRKMSRNYDVSTGEIKASLEGYKKAKEKSGYKKDNKKVDIIIKSLEFLNDNLEVTYDRNNVPGLKLNIFLRNASSYLKKYPELLSEYKILGIVFNENGIKSIEELYNERNSENARLIDNVILSVISVDNVPEREDIRIYLCELISNYNQKTIDFYRNMKYGKVFIDDEMKLADNLRVMMNKSKYLNTVLRSMGMENKQGVVL